MSPTGLHAPRVSIDTKHYLCLTHQSKLVGSRVPACVARLQFRTYRVLLEPAARAAAALQLSASSRGIAQSVLISSCFLEFNVERRSSAGMIIVTNPALFSATQQLDQGSLAKKSYHHIRPFFYDIHPIFDRTHPILLTTSIPIFLPLPSHC